MVYKDNLTGLCNLNCLFKNYSSYISDSSAYAISINIRDFKNVNYNYGETVGDKCIIILSKLIVEMFPDSLIIRRSGDEFLVVTHYACEIIGEKLKKINQGIFNNYKTNMIPIVFSFYSGIKKCCHDLKDTIFKADLTMVHARKNNSLFDYYDESFLKSLDKSDNIVNKINKLIAYNSLSYKIQGVYSVNGKTKIINEINVNENDSTESCPLLSKSEYISKMDFDIIDDIISDIIPRLNKDEKYIITINIETILTYGNKFIEYLNDIIKKSSIQPQNICINLKMDMGTEITKKTLSFLYELKACGIKLCIEGFNLSFNSYILLVISTINIDYIKIDKTLLIKAMNEKKANVILINVIKTFISLNIKPIFIDIKSEAERLFVEKIDSTCLIKGTVVEDEVKIKNTV